MSMIVLPPLHRSARFAMRKVYAASDPGRPAFGTARPIDRPGDHWMIEVEAPAMRTGCGFEFMADIVQGRMTAIRIPQADIDVGAVGSPAMDGAGQSGSLPSFRGLTPHAVVRKGWFLSIMTGGARYTYQVTAEAIANIDGEITFPIWPMLLIPHADGDIVEIAEPWLEGPVIEGGDFDAGGRAVRPGTFAIEQRP